MTRRCSPPATTEPDRPTGAARRLPRRAGLRVALIAGVALVGLLASVALFRLALAQEYRAAESDFQNKAKNHLQVVNDELEAASTLLYTFRAYFNANDHPVSRAEFDRFSRDLHGRVIGLRDTGWAPRVSGAEREAFEREVGARDVPGFQILERGGAGAMVRAAERDEYFPILYLDAGPVTRAVLGFDLSSEPVRRAAIVRARASHRPAATPPVTLMTVKRPNGGVMGFIAIDGEPADANAAPAVTRGVALGVVEIDAMLNNILAERARLAGIDVYLFDPAGPPGDRLIYWRRAAAQGGPAPSEAAVLAGPHRQGTVSMFDQRWSIVFVPAKALETAAWNGHALTPLVVGLAMTAMVVAYLLVSLRRTLQLERLTAELRRHAEQIDHMARHDTLTGLPNRALFNERIADAVARLARGTPFAVLCLDLDHFKSVNDSLGHGAGDRLLCQVAERLAAGVRRIDTVARLGGDEFAILLGDTASAAVAERVASQLVEAIGRRYDLGGTPAMIGLSVGIAIAPGDGDSADTLLARADQALYAAKAAGRGRYCFFEASAGAAR